MRCGSGRMASIDGFNEQSDAVRTERIVSIRGVRVPTFIYGTAWKEDETARLVRMALDCGFAGLDTANQRRHYHEAGVGEALRAVFGESHIARDDLFIQTKFT